MGSPGTGGSASVAAAPAVEVRVAMGNRRLMQEEGAALAPQVGH